MYSLSRSSRLTRSANLRARFFAQSPSRRLVSFTASTVNQTFRRSFPWITALTAVTAAFVLAPYAYLDSEVAKDTYPKFDDDAEVVTDPATSLAFPKTIRVPPKINSAPLTVVGVGVRTVSFLGVKVYSVGFYADLSNPNLKVPKDLSPEEKVEHIIRNTACIIRIVPTRSTNYSHLRDAFVRALQSRLSVGIKNGLISEQAAAELGPPLRKLKGIFPNSPLAKQTPLDVLLTPPLPGHSRALIFRDVGSIESNWVATEFVLNYFDGDGPSPPLKKAVLDKLQDFEK